MSGAVEGVREVAVKTEATRLLFEQIHREGGREVAGHRVTADMAIMAAGVLETVCHDLAAVLTTPPARSYADGVEDAARIVEHGYRCSTCVAIFIDTPSDTLNGGHPDNGCASPNWYRLTEEEQAAAIRLLSQGGRA